MCPKTLLLHFWTIVQLMEHTVRVGADGEEPRFGGWIVGWGLQKIYFLWCSTGLLRGCRLRKPRIWLWKGRKSAVFMPWLASVTLTAQLLYLPPRCSLCVKCSLNNVLVLKMVPSLGTSTFMHDFAGTVMDSEIHITMPKLRQLH